MAKSETDEITRVNAMLFSEKEKAQQFLVLKAELERAVMDAEAGEFELFDPIAFEPEAYDWPGCLKA